MEIFFSLFAPTELIRGITLLCCKQKRPIQTSARCTKTGYSLSQNDILARNTLLLKDSISLHNSSYELCSVVGRKSV
jgi:hypothetical protein